METPERTCLLCGDPIRPDEAWLTDEASGAAAHSGCVYRDEQPDARGRWAPGSGTS